MSELKEALRKHLMNSSHHRNRSHPEIEALVEALHEDSFEVDIHECTKREADQWNSWCNWEESMMQAKPSSPWEIEEEVVMAEEVSEKMNAKRKLRPSLSSASSDATLLMTGNHEPVSDDLMDEDELEEPRRKQPRTPTDWKPKPQAKSQVASSKER